MDTLMIEGVIRFSEVSWKLIVVQAGVMFSRHELDSFYFELFHNLTETRQRSPLLVIVVVWDESREHDESG